MTSYATQQLITILFRIVFKVQHLMPMHITKLYNRDCLNQTITTLIVIVCGLPGVGKTMLAKNLAPLIDASLLSSDKIRKELISKPKYTSNEKKLIYDILILIAKYMHNAGLNCILDATFNTKRSRKELTEKLDITSQHIHMVECICPEHIVISRLKNRKGDYSDANICIYRKMKRIYEPLEEEHMVVDTSQLSAKENAEQIAEEMMLRRGK